MCNRYTKINGCVSGANIKRWKNKTQAQCEQICNRTTGCKGFEFFEASGQREVSSLY